MLALYVNLYESLAKPSHWDAGEGIRSGNSEKLGSYLLEAFLEAGKHDKLQIIGDLLSSTAWKANVFDKLTGDQKTLADAVAIKFVSPSDSPAPAAFAGAGRTVVARVN